MALFGSVKSAGKMFGMPGLSDEEQERLRMLAQSAGGATGAQTPPIMQQMNGAPSMADGRMMGKVTPDALAGAPMINQDSSGLDRYISSTSDAMQQLPTNVPREASRALQPKFLERGGAGEKILAGIGEAALRFSASQGDESALMTLQNREWTRRQNLQNKREDMLHQRDLNKPQYFMSGEDRWRYDPSTGQGQRVVNAPQAFEEYANALGYQQGTPEYNRAAQDWVLRASGPTATDNDLTLENARQTNRTGLEDYRQKNRRELRSIPQARMPGPGRAPPAITPNTVLGGISQKIANGVPLTTGEQQLYTDFRTRGGGGNRRGMSGGGAGTGGGGMSPPRAGAPGGYQRGQTATDPRTGKRKMFNGATWVDIP